MKTRVLALLLFAGWWLPLAHAQGGNKPLPPTNGTSQTRMDAPENNKELESYTHSAMVQRLARRMGISTDQASRYFEDFNSGVLILAILYYLLKYVPGKLREKREGIDRDLAQARAAGAEAQERMKRVERKLASLGGEVEALRRQAAESSKADQEHIHSALEAEKQRIVRQAEAEIAAAQANAQRGLKRYASDLAVERAAGRVELSPENDRVMVDRFLRDLAGQIGKEGRN